MSIAAVIISYNASETIVKCLESALPQVDELIIVDNASSDSTLDIIKSYQSKVSKIKILPNSMNLGIAVALNQAIVHAKQEGHEWILTLDDDSILEENMVQKMLDVYYSLEKNAKHKIAILCPNYRNIKGVVYKEKLPFYTTTAITSGQLLKISLCQSIGKFREDFFIECVDQEYCLRLSKHSLKILMVPTTIINQRLGKPVIRRFLWRKVAVANHLPLRYYYIYRNSISLYFNYLTYSPSWILNNIISNIFLLVKIICFEKDKISKLKMAFLGCLDAIAGNYGKKAV